MEAINEFTFWSLLLIALLLGLVSGFLVSYLWLNQDSRARSLQAELERSREELDQYKQKVNQHFQKTAELFEDMTERYREVYRHLAASSQDLCGEQPPALQNPETRPQLAERRNENSPQVGAESATKASTEAATDKREEDENAMFGDSPYLSEADRAELDRQQRERG
ncbi:uncharacterized protein FOKN1_0835 [Thiohalobacter thiocyanaticus]|uniref:Z-ring associated protein G n=1 Tax=Thiohalobacter thiocyanaticus TaxID=585455 RepID=A0A1Z4VNQ2_9GAMM|nr:DUF1043 family protein [Thiohalobacter thiocyanaticus]BAZ93237.1 uncharacterized protein FOKN1_0835 [Thiohalobacter thiocyanaticus]